MAPVVEPREQAAIPRNTPEPYLAGSNFDELTPEEQERVREQFAILFISILNQ